MQTYIHYGLGFPGDLLTDNEFSTVDGLRNFPETGEIKIRFRSFTESYEGKDWGTVVLQDLGELPNAGKLCSLRELKTLTSPHVIVDQPTRTAIAAQLASVGLEHLADKVELVIFTANY
jgi:hypothetical protein